MKIAIVGGGLTGLASAFFLSNKKHEVTIFEKEKRLGGLAGGFKNNFWKWDLDYTYHHIFTNDYDFISFAKEINFNKIFFRKPQTASFFEPEALFQFDDPSALLKFPLLSPIKRFQVGVVIAFLKFSPFLSLYEKQTAKRFLSKTMGNDVWKILWEELFRKKFGKYAGNILASFIWARIKKRTRILGYIEGGFQAFIDYLESLCLKNRVLINKGTLITKIEKKNECFVINNNSYDVVLATIPSPLIEKIAGSFFLSYYRKKMRSIKYLGVVELIIEAKNKILDKTYWLNILDKNIPIMVLIQHTNFIDKKHYGNNDILYVANYVEDGSNLFEMDANELYAFFLPYLKRINKKINIQPINLFSFKARYAQPVIDRSFLLAKPDYVTPVKNFYIANLEMTYPFDRGVNFAIKLAREVADIITLV